MKTVTLINKRTFYRSSVDDTGSEPAGQGRDVSGIYGSAEKGIVLLLVLILCAVSLAIVTALLYMITVGTQTSGLQKRYRTALEAGLAATNVMTQVVGVHANEATLASFITGTLSTINATASPTVAPCTGTAYLFTSGTPTVFTGLAAKIMTSSTTWALASGCSTSLLTGPSSYDLKFQLGTNPQYNVYAKVVDTIEGNTNGSNTGGHSLITTGVVAAKSGGGEISMVTIPYQYTVEIEAENAKAGSNERAKLSVLYQY